MTPDEALAEVRKFSLAGYTPRTELEVKESSEDGIILSVRMYNLIDVNTNKSTPYVTHSRHFSGWLLSDTSIEAWKNMIAESIRAAALHELDEFLKYDGKTVNDPHKDEVR